MPEDALSPTPTSGPELTRGLVGSSVVVLAHDMNMTIFKPAWLTANGILKGEEIVPPFVFSPAAVQATTPGFQLLILPDRIQLIPKFASPNIQQDIYRVVGGIVQILPHTPYHALGLNFEYLVGSTSCSFHEWNRSHFAAPFPAECVINSDTAARFGAYFSYDVMDFRLKIDFKPVKLPNTPPKPSTPQREAVRATFNFHTDLSTPPDTDHVLRLLGRWREALEHSTAIVSRLSNDLG